MRNFEKLTDADKDKIVKLFTVHGITKKDIAKRFNCSASYITNALRSRGVNTQSGRSFLSKVGITPIPSKHFGHSWMARGNPGIWKKRGA